jgi:hypothetical protein
MIWIDLFETTAAIANNCTNGCDLSLPRTAANENTVKIILQIVFGVLGAISVFFVVFGGFKFVLSNGDPSEAAKARQTIIYAVVGLVVAVLAEAIVGLVIKTI